MYKGSFKILFFGMSIILASMNLVRANENKWRLADLENILFVKTDHGNVLIELSPDFAPNHVKHMRLLTREGFFNNRIFYRVIENFIAQTGSGDDLAMGGNQNIEKLVNAEFTIPYDATPPFTSTGNGDPFADETGFSSGFPVGRDRKKQHSWISHCPGAVGMARNDHSNSGGTDWYVVIGQSPRHLDRNITVFGRVIDGLDVIYSMPHGSFSHEGSNIKGKRPGRISDVIVMSDLPKSQQPIVHIENTNHNAFFERLEGRKKRNNPWYIHKPPAFVDLCTVTIRTQIKWPEK